VAAGRCGEGGGAGATRPTLLHRWPRRRSRRPSPRAMRAAARHRVLPAPRGAQRARRAPTPPRAGDRGGFSRVPFDVFDAPPPSRRRRRRDDDDGEAAWEVAADDPDVDYGITDEATPGTQVARMQALQAEAEARRDAHFAMHRAHSLKASLLSAVVLVCTTAGGTSGLISLTADRSGGGGGFGGGSSAIGAAGGATAALLSPVLGYAATLFTGWQQYSKPSATASRHLTAGRSGGGWAGGREQRRSLDPITPPPYPPPSQALHRRRAPPARHAGVRRRGGVHQGHPGGRTQDGPVRGREPPRGCGGGRHGWRCRQRRRRRREGCADLVWAAKVARRLVCRRALRHARRRLI